MRQISCKILNQCFLMKFQHVNVVPGIRQRVQVGKQVYFGN